jgi:hypothetical protein
MKEELRSQARYGREVRHGRAVIVNMIRLQKAEKPSYGRTDSGVQHLLVSRDREMGGPSHLFISVSKNLRCCAD